MLALNVNLFANFSNGRHIYFFWDKTISCYNEELFIRIFVMSLIEISPIVDNNQNKIEFHILNIKSSFIFKQFQKKSREKLHKNPGRKHVLESDFRQTADLKPTLLRKRTWPWVIFSIIICSYYTIDNRRRTLWLN